ncbi:hypothetical protein [Adhaeribacter terreus]|uniref:DUF4175 family protein n=1 Tax=Adhaeribacter terreus TaxID=529703 RepID=A0ABW0E989_9BACT
MQPEESLNNLLFQLQAFKKKFYLNLLIKGAIFSVGLLATFFLLYNLLEYYFYFPNVVRAFLLFSFIGIAFYSAWHWLWVPVLALADLKKVLSDEEAAAKVGGFYPEIRDKLLNTIQLRNLSMTNDLIAASLSQKASQFRGVEFKESIKLSENRPLLKYVLVPMAIVLGILLIYPSIFVQGTERIVNFKQFYAPPAPFEFVIQNEDLKAYKNEDFQLKVNVKGKTLPNQVSIVYNGREQLLKKVSADEYVFDFRNLQKPVDFQLAGSGFFSDEYALELLARPNLKDFKVVINYPTYLKKASETVENSGNLTVPEGSLLTWNFDADETEKLTLAFQNPDQVVTAEEDDDQFQVSKKIMQSQAYQVQLQNQYGENKDEISYQLTTIPDRAPDISLENFNDTTLYQFLVVGGSISDDYGLTRLNLNYRITNPRNGQTNSAYKAKAIHFDPQQVSQTYFHKWDITNLKLQPGDQLEYFVQVWDNDGLHGSKSAKTRTQTFKLPSRQDMKEELAANAKSVQSQLSQTLEQTLKQKEELNKTEDKFKLKKELTWQDKKQLQDLVDKKKQLEKDLEALQQMNDQLNKQENRFDEKSQELAEKSKELQKLMNELLDPETKKLYEELEKLLQEKRQNDPELQKLLDKLNNKENTLEKELERALELFKQLQFEQKLETTQKQLEQIAKEQEKLAEKTEEKKADSEQLKKEQEQLNKEFQDVKKDIDELQKLDKDLKGENDMDQSDQDQEDIEKDQQDSQESLEKNQSKKASKSQKSAAQKMEKLAKKMEQSKKSQDMEEAQENLDDLRAILENLLKLSFDEEALMKDFRAVNQSDPRFVALGQQQLKLKDDAKMIQDSLYALAKRVFQIQSFVTREVGNMNQHINSAVQEIKERNVGKATGHQQMAMTSINNLALMLNDALKQMQQQMAQQMKGDQTCSKPGGKKPKKGNMAQMQSELNQKIEDLKKGQGQGKSMSEELAKLAAQQEALRQALKELQKQGQEKGEKPGNGKLGDLAIMMEQTETDLVNKRLTEQTIMRQREIMTRLLEAEKSARERELDNKRESQTAQERQTPVPPSFEKYLKQKQKQTEILKTVSPAFSPYYKQEVNEYFQKLGKN